MRAAAIAPALIEKLIPDGLCNPIEIAELNAGEEMTPFIYGKLTDWPTRLRRVSYHDKIASACDLYACPVITGP
jgi:hypothetical protein